MAPIASESTITAAVPLHFGPIVPEVRTRALPCLPACLTRSQVNTPWFKLFLYHQAKTGPPSVLYPKGYRVTHLPDAFMVRFLRFLMRLTSDARHSAARR